MATNKTIQQQFGVKPTTAARNTRRSAAWLQNKIKKVDPKLLTTRPLLGHMYLFSYDPKYKNTLPFYDRHPLIFVIEKYPGGFLGLNLHYLPPKLRLILLNKLTQFKVGTGERAKLQLRYNTLKGATSLKMVKPTIHRYLTSHMRSKMVAIPEEEWEEVVMLPVARFVGSTNTSVYKHSRGMI